MATFTKIDQDTCIACGSCSAEAENIFAEVEGSGIAFSKLDDNKGITSIPEDEIENLEYALESCPTDSILVQKESFEV